MLGAVDSKPLEEFTPRKRETYSDANQFFQDSPDLRKALLQEPLEIADMENIIPMRKGSLSDPKGESTELVNTAKEPESATRNRRPGGPTASTVLVKSPSGRGERMEAANDKIASKVSVSKGSFCSSNQKSTTSTTASRISKNGLDKVTNSFFTYPIAWNTHRLQGQAS